MGLSAWRTVSIGDLGKVVTGSTPSSKHPELFGDAYPFITPTDIDDSHRHVETERFLSEEGRSDQIHRILPSEATCFVCIGATIGKICMTNSPSFTNQQINSIIVDKQYYDADFVFYLLRTKREVIKNLAGGAATPIINKTTFSSVEIAAPPFPIQKKIASILSAYDDLIENNLRRIKLLEEMAQLIYREWFVKFRFPGHEKVRMVDSPLGKIPKGWQFRNLGNLSELRKDKYTDQDEALPLLDMARMPQHTLAISEMGRPEELATSRILFEKDDILFGSIRAYLHKVCLAPCRGVTNISVFVIRPATKAMGALLPVLLSSEDTIRWAEQNSTGTKMPVIKWDLLQKMPVLMPEDYLLDHFQRIVHPMIETIQISSQKNRILRQTRDILLPKLISGELDVSDLDIKVSEDLR